jgi:hypothetical protein
MDIATEEMGPVEMIAPWLPGCWKEHRPPLPPGLLLPIQWSARLPTVLNAVNASQLGG